MNRQGIWGGTIVSGLLAAAGYYFTGNPILSPTFETTGGAVPEADANAFYLGVLAFSIVMGASIGGLAGWLAPRTVRHEPRESADEYNSRVVWLGVKGGVVAALLALAIAAFLAANFGETTMPPLRQVVAILVTPSALFVPIAAAVAAIGLYAVAIRSANWGGRYALIPHLGRRKVANG